jgi:hypothetical protein
VTSRGRSAALAVVGLAVACASPSPESDSKLVLGPDEVSWAGPVDFTYLRTQYGDRDDYSAVCEEGRPLGELYDAANRKDWNAVLALSGPWLVECPVDIDAHFLRWVACDEVGRTIDATHHSIWFHGLVDSVLDSGRGVAEDPYIVISMAEEESMLRALRLEHEEQRLVRGGVDAITARDANGATVTLYFLAEAHWRRLQKSLEEEE